MPRGVDEQGRHLHAAVATWSQDAHLLLAQAAAHYRSLGGDEELGLDLPAAVGPSVQHMIHALGATQLPQRLRVDVRLVLHGRADGDTLTTVPDPKDAAPEQPHVADASQ
jgi:hypothetical protein